MSDRVYITKYALSQGIISVPNDPEVFREEDGYGFWYPNGRRSVSTIVRGTQFCYSLEGAKQQAEKMRNRKISALRKQLQKLEKMEILVSERGGIGGGK